MSRKVFLSFLGTSIYKETYYKALTQDESEVKPTRFIQEATIRNYCQNFSASDQIYIFTTKKALGNWELKEHEDPHTKETILYDPLKKKLEALQLHCQFQNISIKDGKTPEELWDIFKTVYQLLEPKDEIIFDITHGFRTLPMFNMVLINYAKLLKGVTVSGVFYGNWEARYQKQEKWFSPIWNLNDFVELQDWTNSGQLFFNAGYADSLVEMMKVRNVKGTENIKTFCQDILTNRGINITKGDSSVAVKKLLSEKNESVHSAIKPIFELIGKKFQQYDKDNVLNALPSVKWCIDHRLIQQGYTIISEFLPSYILSIIGVDLDDKTLRNTINGFLATGAKKKKFRFHKDQSIAQTQEVVLEKALAIPHIKKLAKRNQSINAQNRNDINHGGFRKNPKSYEDLEEELGDKFQKLIKVVDKIESEFKTNPDLVQEIREISLPQKTPSNNLLLNLTNHPSSIWPQNQKEAAQEKYGTIQDLAFPQIDPEMDEEALNQLVETYEQKIKKNNPRAVHIMGEMTFTYRLVNLLKEVGINCVASTTNRKASEKNGVKISTFEFVKFRSY